MLCTVELQFNGGLCKRSDLRRVSSSPGALLINKYFDGTKIMTSNFELVLRPSANTANIYDGCQEAIWTEKV